MQLALSIEIRLAHPRHTWLALTQLPATIAVIRA
jgi:hypothetical protein